MARVSGVQMTRCLGFRELSLLSRHASFIVIIINNWIFQFLVPLDFQGWACARSSKADAQPCSSPGEAGSWQAIGLTKILLELMGSPGLSRDFEWPQMPLPVLLPLCCYYPIPDRMVLLCPRSFTESREGKGWQNGT